MQAEDAAEEYENATSTVHSRPRSEVAEFFAGYDLIAPGEAGLGAAVAARRGRAGRRPGGEGQPGTLAGLVRGRAQDQPGAAPGRARQDCRARQGRRARPGRGAGAERPAGDHPRIAGGRQPGLRRGQRATAARTSPTSRGCTTTCSAARTTTRRTGRRPGGPSAVLGEDVVRGTVLQNRQFLGRAVRYLAAEQGIRQFLDIGTGLPNDEQRPRGHPVGRAGQPGRLRGQRPGGARARARHAARAARHHDRQS